MGTECLEHHPVEDHRRQVVCVGIAEVHRHRVTAVTLDDRHQPTLDLVPGLLPLHLHVHPVALHERTTQTVRVVVQLTQGGSLRTQIPPAEHVVHVAADAGDRAGAHSEFETTPGFAQRTGAVGRVLGVTGRRS